MSGPEDFLKRLRSTFRLEAEEHLKAMSELFLKLEKKLEPREESAAVQELFRHAHSLKGAARAVNMEAAEEVCQVLESICVLWKERSLTPGAADFDLFHRSIDVLQELAGFVESGNGGEESSQSGELLKRLKLIEQRKLAIGDDGTREPPGKREESDRAEAHWKGALPSTGKETLRVPIERLEKIFLGVEELGSIKSGTVGIGQSLELIAASFDEWERHWSAVRWRLNAMKPSAKLPTRLTFEVADGMKATAAADFLEWNSQFMRHIQERTRAVLRAVKSHHHSLARRLDHLAAQTSTILMLPASTLIDLFPRIARDLAREQGKELEMVVSGGELEIDKRILDEIKEVLIHLIRNAVDHGVELPEVRRAQRKPEKATLSISVRQKGGRKVELSISDDGPGIDVEKVKHAAVKRNKISAETAEKLGHAEALDLIFKPEVSTRQVVTEISGRGLGLAIAREKTERLGGSLNVQSERGKGTKFAIVIPAVISRFRAVLISSGERLFGLPIGSVESVQRVRKDEIMLIRRREAVVVNDELLPLVPLSAVLNMNGAAEAVSGGNHVIFVVVTEGAERVGIIIDQILGEQELTVRPLQKPISRAKSVGGVAILEDGAIIPVLNPEELIRNAKEIAAPMAASGKTQTESGVDKQFKVLVADDSITSRMLLKNILEGAGYLVKTVVDGREAITELREGEFDLVVSDVEMPRMNGFELTSTIRSDARLAEIPVVLVTALSSREDRERGMDTGANAYVVKSNLDNSNLLEAIRRIL